MPFRAAVLALALALAPRAPFATAATGATAVTAAELRLPSVFADHMVLQRETTAPVWGTCAPDAPVEVAVGWRAEPYVAHADADGRFRVDVETPAAGGPYTLVVTAGTERVELADVLVGEVWLCSGQSNMEWTIGPLGGRRPVLDWKSVVAAADDSELRLLHVEHVVAAAPQADVEARWHRCTRETAPGFSAVAYFFGRALRRELGVPVGLLHASWGGTLCEAWTSAEGLAGFDAFAAPLERLRAIAADGRDPAVGAREARAAWWGALDARGPAAQCPDHADHDWAEMELPREWAGTPLAGFDGVVWFRRALELPPALAGTELALELGPIDDMDTVWLDGRQVGGIHEHGRWTEPRRYRVPAELATAGRHVVAVRVVDTGGGGGLRGEPGALRLRRADGAGPVVPLDGAWRWRRGPALHELEPFPRAGRLDQDWPSALYNGMIAPLAPYAIRGAIWYQGESNRPRAAQYVRLFPALIADWRASFERGAFPFYFVQIAPYRYDGDRGEAAELRDAQRLALAVPHTGMAVTMDVGDPDDIHPRDKRAVGERLALWALARTYGRAELDPSGPLYRAVSPADGALRVEFDHAAEGLVARGGPLRGFTIAGADRVFHPAAATIDGAAVLVRSRAVSDPVAVRYGWGAADEPNLFDASGLPASSFRTDAWPPVSAVR